MKEHVEINEQINLCSVMSWTRKISYNSSHELKLSIELGIPLISLYGCVKMRNLIQ